MASVPFSGQPGLPPFPVWPPPSGGAPVTKWETGPLNMTPPSRTFPAGSYIDGLGSAITTSSVVRVLGGLGN